MESMKNTDARVDAYIEKAPDYSKPILKKLRRLIHRAHPSIEESIKWSTPTFEYKGIVAGMSAFKKHVAFGFWKATAMRDPEGLFKGDTKQSPFAVKVSSVKDLPPDKVIVAYVKEAVDLNERGVKASPSGGRKKKTRAAPKAPDDLMAALKRKKKALATFEGFSPSHKREYTEWVTQAKRAETRKKRIATAVEWMAEGKPRNWKYMKKW